MSKESLKVDVTLLKAFGAQLGTTATNVFSSLWQSSLTFALGICCWTGAPAVATC